MYIASAILLTSPRKPFYLERTPIYLRKNLKLKSNFVSLRLYTSSGTRKDHLESSIIQSVLLERYLKGVKLSLKFTGKELLLRSKIRYLKLDISFKY